jgi:hypothetical protein
LRLLQVRIWLIQAFQYTAKHGEVCPAGWQKGAATMKTKLDSNELKDYWQNHHAKRWSLDSWSSLSIDNSHPTLSYPKHQTFSKISKLTLRFPIRFAYFVTCLLAFANDCNKQTSRIIWSRKNYSRSIGK